MLTLLAVICLGAMLEFYKMARLSGADPLDTYPTVLGVLGVLAAFFVKTGKMPSGVFVAFLPAVFALFVAELYRKRATPFANIAWALAGLVYIALPMALLAFIPVQGASVPGYIVYHPLTVLGIILIVWGNDVGAYLFGVAFGRHKLFERISPKKSWEGFAGGLLCAVGVGVLMGRLQGASLWLWGGAGLVVALAGVFGDLVESMMKRSVGLKDSGNVIPGHGGFLDRFDALLLAVPFVFTYFYIFVV